MSKLLVTLISSMLLSFTACAEKSTALPVPSETKATEAKAEVIVRGVQIDHKKTLITLDEISDHPEKYAEAEVLVEGSITAVCQAKGCWMTMAGNKATARARVTFKDYAFFVPKDVKGKKIKLLGTVQVKLMSEAERVHLAEDAKVDVAEIPKAELRLVATGVEIRS